MALTTASASRAGNGLGPRTQIISATVADQSTLDAAVKAMGAAGHTVAGIEGSTGGTMHFAIQGGAAIAAGSAFGLTVAEVCTFEE